MGKALCGQESDELIFLVLLVHHYINDAIYILLIIKVSKKKIMSPIKTAHSKWQNSRFIMYLVNYPSQNSPTVFTNEAKKNGYKYAVKVDG